MVQNKYLKWFVPIIFILSIFVHISAMISFIPFFALIVLLEASRNEKNRKSYIFIFAVSVLMTVAIFLYFTAFEESNLSLSLDSFRAFISERNDSEWSDYTIYYDYALYKVAPGSSEIINFDLDSENSVIARVFETILIQINQTFQYYSMIERRYCVETINDILLSVPIIVMLYRYVLAVLKSERKNKLKYFVWLCALLLLPLAFIMGSLGSPDTIRWFNNSVMLLFMLVIYEMYRSDMNYLGTLSERINHSSYFVGTIYFVFYFMCTVNPYC